MSVQQHTQVNLIYRNNILYYYFTITIDLQKAQSESTRSHFGGLIKTTERILVCVYHFAHPVSTGQETS